MGFHTCCGRREVLGASGVVMTTVLLGGCSSAADRASDAATTNRDAASAAAAAEAEAEGAAVATISEVPVGGGLILASARTVITQPAEGEFKAFSSICTHQGCTVSSVEDGQIVCACHGSHFDIATGEVTAGPANSPLPEQPLTVEGDEITLG